MGGIESVDCFSGMKWWNGLFNGNLVLFYLVAVAVGFILRMGGGFQSSRINTLCMK